MAADQDLVRIEGRLSDISVTLGSIDAHLERLAVIARTTAAIHLGFDPATGTELEDEASRGTADRRTGWTAHSRRPGLIGVEERRSKWKWRNC